MRRLSDGLLVLLLALAALQAALLAARPGGAAREVLPLLAAGDPPGGRLDVHAKVATVGETLTVEDLARGALALEEGKLPGAAPLSADERDRVRVLLKQAAGHRDELLRIESEIATAEAQLGDQARAVAATLTPEQRAWVMAERDKVSVGQIERAYWDALLVALEKE